MIKNSFSMFALVFLYFLPLAVAKAQPAGAGSNGHQFENPLGKKGANSIPELISGIIDAAIQLGTIVAALSIIYGGFLYVTAQGNEEKLGKAYQTVTWALVGTAILLGARVIVAAITGTLGQINGK